RQLIFWIWPRLFPDGSGPPREINYPVHHTLTGLLVIVVADPRRAGLDHELVRDVGIEDSFFGAMAPHDRDPALGTVAHQPTADSMHQTESTLSNCFPFLGEVERQHGPRIPR